MSRQRSPNYPGNDLEAAIDDARAIYSKEGRSPFQSLLAAKAFGHATLNGPSRRRIASLRQYGLVDHQKGEQDCLSERALTLLIRPTSSNEWKGAVRAAALEPPLFQELRHKIGASEESITHDLILKRHFTEDGATLCAKVFKATMAFAGLTEPLLIQPSSDTIASLYEDLSPSDVEHETTQKVEPTMKPNYLSSLSTARPQVVQLPLSPTTWARLEALFPMTEKAWDQMIALLEAMKPGLTHSVQEEEQATTTESDDEQ